MLLIRRSWEAISKICVELPNLFFENLPSTEFPRAGVLYGAVLLITQFWRNSKYLIFDTKTPSLLLHDVFQMPYAIRFLIQTFPGYILKTNMSVNSERLPRPTPEIGKRCYILTNHWIPYLFYDLLTVQQSSSLQNEDEFSSTTKTKHI